jgi:hypothetical protein
MRDLGYSFSWVKLLKALFLEVLDILCNPKKTLTMVVRKSMRIVRESMVRSTEIPRQSDSIAGNRAL